MAMFDKVSLLFKNFKRPIGPMPPALADRMSYIDRLRERWYTKLFTTWLLVDETKAIKYIIKLGRLHGKYNWPPAQSSLNRREKSRF